MPKASPIQSSFLGGELSPYCFGRVDADRYKIALDTCLNYLPILQGGVTRRPGFRFVAEAKFFDKFTILVRFEFSKVQAYILEFGDGYVRFFMDQGQIVETAKTIDAITQSPTAQVTINTHGYSNGDEVFLSGIGGMTALTNRNFIVDNVATNTFDLRYRNGTSVDTSALPAYTSGGTAQRVYELATTYFEGQLRDLTFVQSADVLYICHPSHPPRKLSRTGHTAWTLTEIAFLDGPYLPIDLSGTTITPSNSTSLTPNLTASAALFAATDVGRVIRLFAGGTTWKWMRITGFSSSTVVTVVRLEAGAIGTSAIPIWRLGVWSATTGYPAVATFYEDRLVLGGATNYPQRFDMSVTSDYENFAPTDSAGNIADDAAISRSLNSKDVNNVYWMSGEERALLMGTPAGEWTVRAPVQSAALSTVNISAKQVTDYGSAKIQPVSAGKATFFVQGSGRVLREMSYFYEEDGFRSPDRTILADHISGAAGFRQLSRQKEKPSLIWGVREDGVLAGMTYEKEDDSLIVAWHRHVIGGASDAAGSDAKVEWSAVIPAPGGGKRDDTWIISQRWINGQLVRYIEVSTKIFEETDLQRDAFFVDCGLTYDNPLFLEGVTRANPAVGLVTGHGLQNGDKILISDVKGMTEINDKSFIVRNRTTDTFELEAMDGTALDSTDFQPFVMGGAVRKFISQVQGLWHLEGETVDIWADGAVQPPDIVVNGIIAFQNPACTVHIGYAYRSRGKLLRMEAGAADGTALGKTRRTHRVGFLLYRTLGFRFGMSFDAMREVVFRTNNDADGRAPALFTGIYSETIDADADFENQICFEQNRPAPGMVLAVMPQMQLEDRG